ncbi:MAG: restriction endonuclease subunit S [Bacteroidales bacterium]|nr:restriction endonuclease subunit S [Bacteroidales bacterium]
MNKVEELIQQLCPEGVEYKELGDVVVIVKGKQLNKELLTDIGTYPAYNGGISFSGFTDNYNYDENTIIISQGGASAGFVNFITTKFYANAHCYVVLPNNEVVINRYVYHFLKLNQERLTEKQHGAGIPALKTSEIAKLLIPIPPLPVQQEIVTILDTFTQLEAELEAELEARKKQYEYYRNELLTFGDEVEWKTLGEVGEFIRGNGLQKKDFTQSGVGCIHYGQIYTYYGTFTHTTKSFVSKELAKKLVKVTKNDLIITNTSENLEDVCKSVVWLGENEIVTGGHATVFKHSQNPKYLAYYTQTPMFFSEKKKLAKGTKVIDVSAKDLAKIPIPIPPLTEQEHIVSILDKFDALVNDITIGLPAEIEARRKQYEYYREKLLSFEKAE